MTIGNRIEDLLNEANMNRNDLADRLKISYSAVSKYITDKRTPDAETLNKIADIFEVTTDYLMGRTNQKYFRADETISFHSKGKLSDEDMKMVRDLIDRLVKDHKEEKKKD